MCNWLEYMFLVVDLCKWVFASISFFIVLFVLIDMSGGLS